MKKIIVLIVVVSGLGVLGWQIYQKAVLSAKGGERQRPATSIAVETAPVQKTIIRETGNFTGSLHAGSEFVVAPKISGRLERLPVRIGDTVRAGDILAVLDSDEYSQQVIQARAELEVARANLEERKNAMENAEREYERTRALREKKIASESQLDTVESEFKIQQAKFRIAGAQISQKEAALKMAEIRVSYTKITVPGNSVAAYVVGERFVDEGALLAPNTPIVSILDIDNLMAVTHVTGRDYPAIQPGQDVSIFTDAFPGQTFTGKVARIAPVLKERSREARVEIDVPNESRSLKPGMFVRIQIRFAEHDNATVVPVASLVRRNDQQGVFLVDSEEQKVRFVPVVIGFTEGPDAEVLRPDITGAVVTLGHHLLEDGDSVVLSGKKPDRGKE